MDCCFSDPVSPVKALQTWLGLAKLNMFDLGNWAVQRLSGLGFGKSASEMGYLVPLSGEHHLFGWCDGHPMFIGALDQPCGLLKETKPWQDSRPQRRAQDMGCEVGVLPAEPEQRQPKK